MALYRCVASMSLSLTSTLTMTHPPVIFVSSVPSHLSGSHSSSVRSSYLIYPNIAPHLSGLRPHLYGFAYPTLRDEARCRRQIKSLSSTTHIHTHTSHLADEHYTTHHNMTQYCNTLSLIYDTFAILSASMIDYLMT